jgi:RHS repeat-associated protein
VTHSFRRLVVPAFIIVACGSDMLEDPTGDTPGATPSTESKPPPDAGLGGTGGVSEKLKEAGIDDDGGGGAGGAPDESADGGGVSADGRVDGESKDAAEPDVLAAEPCDLNAPFEAPVAAFTGSMDADGLTFSADGRTAYISGAGPGARDIYVATRTSPEGIFGPPTLVEPVNTLSIERSPSVAPDGRLYFTKQTNNFEIGRAIPAAPPFTSAQAVPEISSAWQDEDPFWWGNNTLYFVSERETAGAHRDIFRAAWNATNGTFSGLTMVANVNSTAEELHPVLSPDGLTLYFGSRRHGIGNDTSGDVWMARRPLPDAEFAAPVNLWGFNNSGIDFPVTVSADGCTLYFASTEETGLGASQNFRLYQATRGASTPSQVTLRLNILGTGSVTQPPFNCTTGNVGTCSATAPPDTTWLVNANTQAQWTGSCSGNGGQPSTDGVLTFSQNGVCTIKFAGAPLVGAGGLCSLSVDCQAGLSCVNNTCGGGCAPGVCNASCPCDSGGPCDEDSDCNAGLTCQSGACGCAPDGTGSCGAREPCSDASDCQPGLTCGLGEGSRFGGTWPNVCIDPSCLNHAPNTSDCGSLSAECGLCPPCLNPAGCSPPTRPLTTPLPENEVAGDLGGDFAVSDSGTATYSIGLPLPPGRNDMTPELGLVYDSSERSELIGVGWQLTGMSYITLCNAPAMRGLLGAYPHERLVSSRRGVRGEGDAICIDGMQMVEVADPYECSTPPCRSYRTVPNSFRRIRGIGDLGGYPEYFEVSTSEGLTLTYGQGNANVLIELDGKRRVWALNRTQDQRGNYIEYAYHTLTGPEFAGHEVSCGEDDDDKTLCGTTQISPHEVRYTGFDNGSLQRDPTRTVRFNYEEEEEENPVTGYVAGRKTTRTKSLNGIDILIDGTIVRSFIFDAQPALNGMRELLQVWDCFPELDDPDEPNGPTHAKCKTPTKFEYYAGLGLDPQATDSGVTLNPSTDGPPMSQIVVHDANCDGRDDLLVAEDSTSGPFSGAWKRLTTSASGTGFVKDSLSLPYDSVQIHPAGGQAGPAEFTQGNVGDYNGDGCDDVFETKFNGRQHARVLMGNRDSIVTIENTKSNGTHEPLSIAELPFYGATIQQLFTDVDGDGRPDYVLNGWNQFRERQIDGEFFEMPVWRRGYEDGTFGDWEELSNFSTGSSLFPIDLDGDHATDLVSAVDGKHGRVVNWGALTEVPFIDYLGLREQSLSAAADSQYVFPPEVVTIDMNGDGLKDALTRPTCGNGVTACTTGERGIFAGNAHVTLHVNTGAGFAGGESVGQMTHQEFRSMRVLDYDGDGSEDVIRWSGNEWVLLRGREDGFYEPESLDLTEPLILSYSVLEPGPTGELGGRQLDHPWSTVADVDGDGALDFVVLNAQRRLMIHRSRVDSDGSRSATGNMLKAVTNGLGERVEVEYDRPDDPAYAARPRLGTDMAECGILKCLARIGRPLVRATRSFAGVDFVATGTVEYRYRDARVDARGKGWVGFAEREIDSFDGAGQRIGNTRIAYDRAFDNQVFVADEALGEAGGVFEAYLAAGLPTVIEEVYPAVPSDLSLFGRAISRTVTQFWENAGGVGTISEFIRLAARSTSEQNFQDVVSSVYEAFEHDEFGNVTERTELTFGDGPIESAVETTVFRQDTERWLLRIPEFTTIERTRGDAKVPSMLEFSGETISRDFDYVHDEFGQLVLVARLQGGLKTLYTRNDFGNVERIDRYIGPQVGIGPLRTTAIDEYDDDDIFPTHVVIEPEIESKLAPDDLPLQPHAFTYEYDERFGVMTSVEDPNGLAQTWQYDAFGRLERQTRPDGSGATIRYDFAEYDDTGPISVPAVLRKTTTIDGVDGPRVEEFDSLGRRVRVQSKSIQIVATNGNAVTADVIQEFGYDAAGRLDRASRPHLSGDTSQGMVIYSYNALDELVRVQFPGGATVEYDRIDLKQLNEFQLAELAPGTHDAMVFVRTDANSNVERRLFDVKGLLGTSIDALGGRTTYVYDSLDKLRFLNGPRGVIEIEYNPVGQVFAVRDPDRGEHTYGYTAFEEPATHTTPDHGTENFRYDPFGRLKRIENADGVRRWEYDQATHGIGKLSAEIVEAGGTARRGNSIQYTYDDHGRLDVLTHIVRGENYSVDIDYTLEGRAQFIRYPSAGGEFGVENVYDSESGLLQEVREFRADNVGEQRFWRLQETHQGVRVRVERLGPAVRTTRDYDNDTGLPTLIHSVAGGIDVQKEEYVFDDNGNLLSRDDVRDDVDETLPYQKFEYDPLNRLRAVLDDDDEVLESINLDDAGNITSKTGIGDYFYDDPASACDPDGVTTGVRPHAVTKAGTRCFRYDDSGNQIFRSGPMGEQRLKYTLFGLPYEIVRGNGEGAQVTELEYSASGTRIGKNLLRQGDTDEPEDRVEDAFQVYVGSLYELRAPCDDGDCENTDRTHVYRVFGGGREVAQVHRAEEAGEIVGEETFYLHHDHLGSPSVITNGSDAPGDVVKRQRFSPFGSPEMEEGAADVSTGFAGLEADGDSGLVNMRGRLYDPELGRFVSADPFTPAADWTQGLNRYAYVFNNPLNLTDPSGFGPPGYTDIIPPPVKQTAADKKEEHSFNHLWTHKNRQATMNSGNKRQAPTGQTGKAGKSDPDAGQPGTSDGKTGGGADGKAIDGPPVPGKEVTHGKREVREAPPKQNTTMGKVAAGVGIATGSAPDEVKVGANAHEGDPGGIPGGTCSGPSCISGGGVQAVWVGVMLFGNKAVDRAVSAVVSAASRAASAVKSLFNKVDSAIDRALAAEASKASTAIQPYYPSNRGFLQPPTPTTLAPGTRIDRFGPEGGTFASPEGTPFGARGLPPEQAGAPYTVYEVVKPLPAQAGQATPWFGQPGLGTQYEFSMSIGELRNQGFVQIVGP